MVVNALTNILHHYTENFYKLKYFFLGHFEMPSDLSVEILHKIKVYLQPA